MKKNDKRKKRQLSEEVEEIFDFSDGPFHEESLSHYFTDDGELKDEIRHFEYKILGKTLQITSNSGVFSKNHVDRASDLLIHSVLKCEDVLQRDACSGGTEAIRIADLGSGYGIILLSLLTVLKDSIGVGYEVSNRAGRLARINAKKNGLKERVRFEPGDLRQKEDCEAPFDLVVTNPPIRAGKDVVYAFYEFAFRNLSPNGRLYVVISKNQGANSTKKYLEELFGNAEIVKKESEFRVIKAIKQGDGNRI
ncbi:MAG: methyltransferase [Bacillota bacterium]|nr:methyltransferase [Bacillota bacterium]